MESAGQGDGDNNGQRYGQYALGNQGYAAEPADGGAVGAEVVGGVEKAHKSDHGRGDEGADEPAEGDAQNQHDTMKARHFRQIGIPRKGGVVDDPESRNEQASDRDDQADVFLVFSFKAAPKHSNF